MSTQSYEADFITKCRPAHNTDSLNVAILTAGPLTIGLHHNEAVEIHRQLDKILRDGNGHIVTKPILLSEKPLEQWETDLLDEHAPGVQS